MSTAIKAKLLAVQSWKDNCLLSLLVIPTTNTKEYNVILIQILTFQIRLDDPPPGSDGDCGLFEGPGVFKTFFTVLPFLETS